MNYPLHQLNVFVKISPTLSITQVAEEFHLTQPGVFIQLKNFQDQDAGVVERADRSAPPV